LERLERVVLVVGHFRDTTQVEIAHAVVLERREPRVLAKDRGGRVVGKRMAEAHAARDLGHDPPVGPRLAGHGQERALPRDAALGVRHGARLLAPGRGRQQHVRAACRVRVALAIRDDDERHLRERAPHALRVGHAHDGIRRHDP
jgi:hypothetical protein